ncbi:S1C family serine protease [Limosilactobacillus fermentum]|uniref:S1C family serine protease n=1 Tax=Limosilactobacillus fermentum TaxID=1613 RepID=UPI0009731392|nr:trypsin-like peptidase domain-containing protein [Limosilactobacillus fermentum]MBM9559837.1 trypsin-like peptidase domain-containing protein [Limosilactobacillus fermentum]MCD5423536.1 trypsin-like peptidase domain-containing protein [Limosilactobacillus fermentum]MPW03177.1 PDZ domain-containing protein [Limosilactobacillus fermentum]BAW85744.1 serine protease [Limosilactobacillus fermentum]
MKKHLALQQRRFWGKVILVGVLAGLLGGGAALGINSAISTYRNYATTKVPAGSSKSGGTSVSKNKASLTNETTKAYNATKNAVVSVINKQATSSSDSLYGNLETASEGSGVIYKKSGNVAYVVTNNHVVSGSSEIQVILSNGKTVDAQIVGTDETTDLAVLKINAANVTTVATFGNSNDIAAGQDVIAIGSPMGSEYANTVTKGIISATKRTVKASDSSVATTVIQTDAAINSGNSGGPLVNMAGQVIGINSMKLASSTDGTSVEGMGFSIPSNEVVRVINQLIKNGKITRPTLGVSLLDLSDVSSSQQQSVLNLPTSVTKGVVVMKVESGYPTANAGLQQYDVITSINGKKVTDAGDLKTVLYKYKVGDTVTLTYYRDGSKKTAKVELNKEASSSTTTSSSSSDDATSAE